MQRKQHRRGARSKYYREVTEFGHLVTGDFIVSYTTINRGVGGETEVLVLRDKFTGWTQGFPMKSRSVDHT